MGPPYLNVKHTSAGVELDVTIGLTDKGEPDFALFRLTEAEREDLIACLKDPKECQKRALQQAQLPPDSFSDRYRTVAHGRRLSVMPDSDYAWDD